MGLKVNVGKVPLRWRLLLGAQLVATITMMAYRMRVVKMREEKNN